MKKINIIIELKKVLDNIERDFTGEIIIDDKEISELLRQFSISFKTLQQYIREMGYKTKIGKKIDKSKLLTNLILFRR